MKEAMQQIVSSPGERCIERADDQLRPLAGFHVAERTLSASLVGNARRVLEAEPGLLSRLERLLQHAPP